MPIADLLPPPVLFFALGFAAAALRSDLSVPDALAKALSLYLMMAIGLKGGIAVAQPGAAAAMLPALGLGVALSALLPIPAYAMLRAGTGLDRATAAAVSAHYGSVSVVTFAAAAGQLDAARIPYEGFMPAVLAAMETPAILTALLLARRGGAATSGGPRELAHEVLLNGSVVLLLGAFLIGWIAGPAADRQLAPFITGLFPGALCLFLLEMGLTAARRLRDRGRGLDARLVGFALLMPLIGGAAGLGAGLLAGLSPGGVGLMAVLGASASYIAVPAAMRMALPSADAGIYVTLSLAVTFPFNILAGIPLWLWAARAATGG
ncbi:sodium-dependent bicarbonate transport family permease [Roseomonas sp. PWR1]|uniref:Sodium-dependent bicarbonate transport family permease n=1 Tax=Roseomonas nitratireducens TaxID=2820810 RepID=A0ABS4AVX1_9PROT|nr:sodium-dependent bicarbonate transport family permease [Neoroseomonas nitratireducens]MBP0464712.1 sodium-dependent bicarbonate transport family permease [Neoroseomonas nitratireducens]